MLEGSLEPALPDDPVFPEEPLFPEIFELLLLLIFDVEFDVEVPELSCSVPLSAQPVRVAAMIAPTRRETNVFLIDYPFLFKHRIY